MRRRLMGLIALALIAFGTVGSIYGGDSVGQTGLLFSACVRVGCLLGAMWLAFPQLAEMKTRMAPWLVGACVLAGVAVAVRPKSLAIVGPLLLVLMAMHFLRRRG